MRTQRTFKQNGPLLNFFKTEHEQKAVLATGSFIKYEIVVKQKG